MNMTELGRMYSRVFTELFRPVEEICFLFMNVFWGKESTIEDIILLIGTFVAFVAFILWCCFPVVPKEIGTSSKPILQMQNNVCFKNCNSEDKYNQIEYESNNQK